MSTYLYHTLVYTHIYTPPTKLYNSEDKHKVGDLLGVGLRNNFSDTTPKAQPIKVKKQNKKKE